MDISPAKIKLDLVRTSFGPRLDLVQNVDYNRSKEGSKEGNSGRKLRKEAKEGSQGRKLRKETKETRKQARNAQHS